MHFSKKISTLIQSRFSVRNYTDQPIDAEALRSLRECITQDNRGVFGNTFDFVLVTKDQIPQTGRFGTYGMIANVHTMMIGKASKNKWYLEDYGYVFEKKILKATELGLGTCWLGGSIKRSDFSSFFTLAEHDILPAATPVGYGQKKRSLRDILIRLLVGAHRRKRWDVLFFNSHFSTPLSKHAAGVYTVPLEMVRLAPSASNKQPWRVIKLGHELHFYIELSPAYQKTFSLFEIQRIDIGIALCHFELACGECGISGTWEHKEPSGIHTPPHCEYVTTWKPVVS